jgi:hypothetical protein
MARMFYIHLEGLEDTDNISTPKFNGKIKVLLEELQEILESNKTIKFVFTGEFIIKPWDLETIEEHVRHRKTHRNKILYGERLFAICDELMLEVS